MNHVAALAFVASDLDDANAADGSKLMGERDMSAHFPCVRAARAKLESNLR
jgi:hypothetical protein